MTMISPSEARQRILGAAVPIREAESCALALCAGRTLAQDVVALRTQPPFATSAMDGYAVRADDLSVARPLVVIGESAAGHLFRGNVGAGETVRIFTGAALPEGADTILIQENAVRGGATITPTQTETRGRFVRRAGLDFSTGDVLLRAGQVLDARHVGLAASMGHAALNVQRKPRVAILSTGDELVMPGDALGEGQIISSNAFALAALVAEAGGEALDHGIVPDDLTATRAAIETACVDADLLITSGGASVGDHDYVQPALREAGFAINFWKVAVRPGKPLMLAQRGSILCIGLPGNPVSSTVCGLLFVSSLIRHMLGQPDADRDDREPAKLGIPLPANDLREEYMRATLSRDEKGEWVATPFSTQDSSIQRLLGQADALLIRPPHAPPAAAGEPCEIIRL